MTTSANSALLPMKATRPSTQGFSDAAGFCPQATASRSAKGRTGADAWRPGRARCRAPWLSAAAVTHAVPAAPCTASLTAKGSTGSLSPPLWCHSGSRRSTPSSSSGVVTTPSRGHLPAGHRLTLGSAIEGHGCAETPGTAPAAAASAGGCGSAASCTWCRPAAASTTGAPGLPMTRASAASPGCVSVSNRSMTMARAPSSRSCSAASA